jgi:subtilisin family serine protease
VILIEFVNTQITNLSMFNKFKSIAFCGILLAANFSAFSQAAPAVAPVSAPNGWHLLDKSKDGFSGISVNKAYTELLKGKKGNTVTVAVIDSGVDTLHEDLTQVLWKNLKEKPGNGKDDDKNGYADDVYGWNFLGGKDGRSVGKDTEEAQRLYKKLKAQPTVAPKDTALFGKLKAKYEEPAAANRAKLKDFQESYEGIKWADSLLHTGLKKDTIKGTDLETFRSQDQQVENARVGLLSLLKGNKMMDINIDQFRDEFGEYVQTLKGSVDAVDSPLVNYRANIVKDNYADFSDRFYGNKDVMAKFAFHGTHVSGIIGAKRYNGLGIDGVADNVKIMMVRAVPDGDEHDKDIALAIRYAVDNGAKVISMSFGKGYSPEKQWVDDAIRYAEKKNVLLVHAAGNDSKNIDVEDNFPNPMYLSDGKRASNMITVGASGDLTNGGLTAKFSNYGKNNVDVFAPGVKIYSTIPGGNTYGNANGTSMAAPVVSGIAALILEHYPKLKPAQVIDILVKSCYKPEGTVTKPGTDEQIAFSELCRSAGIVNAYEALKLAATYK